MKRLKKTAFLVSTLLFVLFFSSCGMYTYIPPANVVSYDNPSWAPPYTPGVRYYYLPDIECYYDLSTQEFVYFNNDGQWEFSQELPPIYAGFDLDNCFTVAIDNNTFQPWMHHHYYVSHYPRYYYRDYYDHSNIPYVRGFNENTKSAVYWPENERSRSRNFDSENLKTNHNFTYSDPDRQHQNTAINNRPATQTPGNNPATRQDQNTGNASRQQPNSGNNHPTPAVTNPGSMNPNRPEGNKKTFTVIPPRISGFETGARQQKEVAPVHPNQNTNYYGRTIGQPVRVQKQMRQPAPNVPRGNPREQNENRR